MASLYLNRLNSGERAELVQTLHNTQQGMCFICQQEVDLVLHAKSIDIDHVEP